MKVETAKETIGLLLKSESAKAGEMLEADVLRSLWYLTSSRQPDGAVLLFECSDRQDVENRVNRLPFVENRPVSLEILNLKPCTSFASLFSTSE